MSNQTSGPWVSFDREHVSNIYSVGNRGAILAQVHGYTLDTGPLRPDHVARRANAHLIAAAPALLVVAKAALTFYDRADLPHMPGEAELLDALSAAIATAEGRL